MSHWTGGSKVPGCSGSAYWSNGEKKNKTVTNKLTLGRRGAKANGVSMTSRASCRQQAAAGGGGGARGQI